jgi:hypothetical protein
MASPDLAERTLQLVDMPSESRSEAALMAFVRELLPGDALFDDGEVLLYGDPGRWCSPGTSTPCRRKGTSLDRSPKAPCTVSVQVT